MDNEGVPSPEGVDIEAAREALGGDDELLRIVTEAFLDESPRLAAELQAALDDRDANRLRMAAHALKGAIRYYGDTSAYQLTYEVELAAAAGEIDDLAEMVSRIDREIQLIHAALLPIVDDNLESQA